MSDVAASRRRFTAPAISDPNDLVFGRALHPLATRSGLVIGGGTVYPELNFTLPPMLISEATMPRIRREYSEIIASATQRAAELEVPGLVIEFETLPPMTENPAWGIEITRILLDGLADAKAKTGLKGCLRITANDTREMIRPPVMRSGLLWENMLRTFDGCAAAGAELLSIESVGGKEVCDEALTMGDLEGVLFALCVLGVRDMRWMWTHLAEIAERHDVHAAGDTACGFANTAMVLAEQRLIPRVFAAVVRVVSAVRSLVAYECGGVGPGKDCGYENVFLKAITGMPMSMEGKTAACAHLSPVGNVSAAAADLWSNESVQNVRLLGAMAPTVSLEQLAYDCRLMNVASGDGPAAARTLRDWLTRSDAPLDPQAYVLSPAVAIEVAQVITAAADPYRAGISAARTAIDLLDRARHQGQVHIVDVEAPWLDRMRTVLDSLPDEEGQFIDLMLPRQDVLRFLPAEYGL